MDLSKAELERWLKVPEEVVEEVDLQAVFNMRFGGSAPGCFVKSPTKYPNMRSLANTHTGRNFAYPEMSTLFSQLIVKLLLYLLHLTILALTIGLRIAYITEEDL